MKALFIDDGIFTKEKISECTELLASVEGLEYDYAIDTNLRNYPGPEAEYILRFETNGPEGWIFPDKEVLEKVADADILILHMSGVTEELIKAGKNLKLIYTMRSGTENINMEAAAKRGIPVCNTPSRLANPVADMTIAHMLCECRGIVRGNLRHTEGKWNTYDVYQDKCNAALCNLTIGLYGYGGIGRAIAKRLVYGFGSKVIAYDPYCPAELMSKDGVVAVDRETLLKESDIVSMLARLTPETKNIFGAEEFAMMKPSAIFINTARAGLVDEQALINALQTKQIRGAGLDVYWEEPMPLDHPLLKMDNVTLTPHRAGVTNDIVPNTLGIMMNELKRFAAGEELQFRIYE